MAKRLSPAFVELVYEAVLKSFWRRNTLWRFLRQAGIADSFLGTWTEQESKRNFLSRLFAKLPNIPEGQRLILSMARDLAQQENFSDLEGWEDSTLKLEAARKAVAVLRSALTKLDGQVQSEKERTEAQERFRTFQEEARRSQQSLEALTTRIENLATSLGGQQAGYDFQTWFYDLMDYFEIENRRPYIVHGRQIDGSVTVAGTTYLVELKFTQGQAGATDIDSLAKKVHDKADNTMGIMISISGYSSTAVNEASGPRTTLLLLDHQHLYLVLRGVCSFQDVVERIRRHASQTGESYLATRNFGG